MTHYLPQQQGGGVLEKESFFHLSLTFVHI